MDGRCGYNNTSWWAPRSPAWMDHHPGGTERNPLRIINEMSGVEAEGEEVKKSKMVVKSTIPTVDLSPFFDKGDDEDGKKKATEIIARACTESGFFQIVNHGLPLELMARAIDLSKTIFQYPTDEKLKWKPGPDAPLPVGYTRQPEHSSDNNEYLLMFVPDAGSELASFNVYPEDIPEFRVVMEETCCQLSKTALIVEPILNECMGLPENFLKEYNKDRRHDVIAALRYFPATAHGDDNGISEHEDANCITFVFQDDVGGLEVLKHGQWIPVTPTEGAIVVNVGDVIHVLSNGKLKSATHRVVRKEGKSRYSYAFFHSVDGEKWVEPLPQFTQEIGEGPKYRGFKYKDYQQLRFRNKSHPPSDPRDVIHISHYAIPP